MTNAVEVRHLSKSIEGSPILNDICMNVRQGEVYGFLGANGAGKTSLMKTLYHIIFPDTGTVCLLGETINKSNNPVFSRIGSIIESPVFYSHLSAYENMELHCRYMGAGYENIMETLSLLGIAETGNKAVGKFSLGMKQRLALARAMLTKPDLLILDEPINGLDPQGIIEVRELLLRINHEYHTSILISSHILDELSKIADTIGIIDHGAMLAEVSMKELTAKGIDLETYYLGLLGGGEKMWNLIRMEIKKVPLKPHIAGLLAANFIIFLLSVFTSSLLTASGNISTLPGFAPVQLDTVTLAAMLVRATLIVWEAVLISVFVIEEYRNKTISLLFTYPISRTKLIMTKLILICSIMFLFHVLSNIFQYASIFLAEKCFSFVTFSIGNILAQTITTISAILLGLLPLYVGMIKKSTIATVVSSIIIVAIASNSQGSSAGLMSIPVAAIIFGIIGIIFSAIAMRKMILSDLSN